MVSVNVENEIRHLLSYLVGIIAFRGGIEFWRFRIDLGWASPE